MEKRRYLNWYKLEDYAIMFEKERWDEIEKIINDVIPAVLEGRVVNGFVVNPTTGMVFYTNNTDIDKIEKHTFDYIRSSILTNILTDDEYEKCIKHFRSLIDEKRDKEIFDKATKIPEEEYGDPVFYADNYYWNTCGFVEMFDDDLEELPEYVFGSETIKPFENSSIEKILGQWFDNFVDLDDNCGVHMPPIPDYLTAAWEKFKEEQKDFCYYEEDRKTVVLINKNQRILDHENE
jgi:hypothetical protein